MIVVRKLYSQPEEQEKSSGLGGALLKTAAIAGTLYGAKKGMLGNTVRTGMNKGIMHVGKALGSTSIVKSGAKDYAKGRVSQINNILNGLENNAMSMTKGRQKDLAEKIANNWTNKMTAGFNKPVQ